MPSSAANTAGKGMGIQPVFFWLSCNVSCTFLNFRNKKHTNSPQHRDFKFLVNGLMPFWPFSEST